MDSKKKQTSYKQNKKEINNVINIGDYIKIPDDYEKDTYVDLNKPIDWDNLLQLLAQNF